MTDVGSVKGEICDSAVKIFENSLAYFVGSHPMAGSEKSGWNMPMKIYLKKNIVLLLLLEMRWMKF